VPLIEVSHLSKIYISGENAFGGGVRREIKAVDDVSFNIEQGETLGLVGESGSGKSTIGRLLLRLIEPTSGTVKFDGRDLTSLSSVEMRKARRDMQVVFQDPFASLDPRMTVEQIVTEPLVIHEKSAAAIDRHRRAEELMRIVGLEASALPKYPHEFSGGQRQRIGIARALALRPRFIVADEPVSALDVSVGARIVNLLRELQREFGLTPCQSCDISPRGSPCFITGSWLRSARPSKSLELRNTNTRARCSLRPPKSKPDRASDQSNLLRLSDVASLLNFRAITETLPWKRVASIRG
jgi:ABC-type glutathione transport system ATPase component